MKITLHTLAALAAFAMFVMVNCKQDLDIFSAPFDPTAEGGWASAQRDGGTATVLGPQLPVPYKVATIKQAYNNLYEPDISVLQPNYLYVRLQPQTPEQLSLIFESGIEFWDFPLDREIESLGESAGGPNGSAAPFPELYAVVPAGEPLPNVPHQVLEELALVPEDCAIAQEAFALSGVPYDVPETFAPNPQLVGNKFDFALERGGNGGPEGPGSGECNCPVPDHIRKPSGCVQVFDNMLNGYDGVINVEVIVSRSQLFGPVFHRKTETDHNGCWKINHKYGSKLHVWVRWENATCNVKTMESNSDLWGYTVPRKAYIGKYNGPNFNNISIKFDHTNAINSFTFRNWAASTANNSVFEFGGFVANEGIGRGLPGNLKILITPWGTGGNTGAAPMLDKMGIIQQVILFTTANRILTGVFGVWIPGAAILALPLTTWLQTAAPDIVFNLNDPSDVNADDVRELAYHELAHALHFGQVGSNYWLANIVYIMDNLGYGDGTAPGAGRCSVIESWGHQIGMIAAHLRYGVNNSNGINPEFLTWRALLERRFAVNVVNGVAFIPYAWQWDLQDDNMANPPNELENITVVAAGGDRVNGVTNAQIFSVMHASMLSIPQMKTELTPLLPPNIPLSSYNTLCGAYGF